MSDRPDDAYPIVVVPAGVARHDEVLGTKFKFWYAAGGVRPDALFKAPRSNEDWSEKVAAELAELLRAS